MTNCQDSPRIESNTALSVDKMHEAGLGYNFSALKDEVTSVLEEGIRNLIPVEEPSDRTISKFLETIATDKHFTFSTTKPRHSINTITTTKLEDAWRRLATEKAKAEDVHQVLLMKLQNASNMARKVELYIATATAIRTVLETTEAPRPTRPATTGKAVLTVSKNSISGNPRRTTNTWQKSITINSRVSLAPVRRGNGKNKAPPPKPEPRLVTQEEFESVSDLVRGKVKLGDINHAYMVLFGIFYEEMLEKIKLMELAKRGVAVSGMTEMAKLKVLRQLKRITLSTDNQIVTPADFV